MINISRYNRYTTLISSVRYFSVGLPLKRNLKLSYDVYEEDATNEKNPIVFSHGLFGSKMNWKCLCREVHKATKRKVIAYDAVNHGRSSHHPNMSYTNMAADLISLLDLLNIEQAITVGHSMGGKTVMVNALLHDDRVEKLVVVDSTPTVSNSTGEVKTYLDAMMAIDLRNTTRNNVDTELAKVAKSRSLRQFLMTNLVKGNDGKFQWRVNLDAILSHYYEHIHGFPSMNDRVFNKDTLFIGGGRSEYISTHHHSYIYQYFPKATIEYVADAGHWVHAEKPKEFLEKVIPFIG